MNSTFPSGDEDNNIRKAGVKIVLDIRRRVNQKAVCNATRDQKLKMDSSRMRPFLIPAVNVNASHYSKLFRVYRPYGEYGDLYYDAASHYSAAVKSKQHRITEPPLLKKLTDLEIVRFIKNPFRPKYSCHSQACERGVKTTSDSCRSKAGYYRQLGQALLTEKSRKDYTSTGQKRTFDEVRTDMIVKED